ncbi:MAG: LCP family protein [Lachnospiraceae bacterium]|nr:LCP family protein [Lachnospiraceae bacterium]
MAKQKKKKRSGKKSLILFIIEIVVLVILVFGIWAYAKINEGLNNIGSKVENGKTTEANSDANLNADDAQVNSGVENNQKLTGYTNIALVGIDTRDSNSIDYANSDTMIIASINNDTGRVRLVSVYRDTLLNIDPNGTANQGGDEFSGTEVSEEEGNTVGTEDGENAEEEDTGDTGEEDAADNGDTGYDDEEDADDYNDYNYDEEDTGDNNDYNYDTEDNDDAGNDNDEGTTTKTATVDTQVDSSSESGQQIGGTYTKCNAAYMHGSIKQFLTMLNMNLDLNLKDCVVVDFKALATLIDDLGGLDMDLLYEEVYMINDYSIETSKVSGLAYTPLDLPEKGTVTRYHLNGVQAVSYARIRYTTGNDPKRTERQRVVINKIVEKAKAKGLTAVNAILEDVLPYCRCTLSNSEIIKMAASMFSYKIEKTSGFPFEHLEKDVYPYGKKVDAVIPVTLEQNVKELHAFLYDDNDYQVTSTVHTISQDIIRISQLGDDSIELAKKYSVSPSIGGETDNLQ